MIQATRFARKAIGPSFCCHFDAGIQTADLVQDEGIAVLDAHELAVQAEQVLALVQNGERAPTSCLSWLQGAADVPKPGNQAAECSYCNCEGYDAIDTGSERGDGTETKHEEEKAQSPSDAIRRLLVGSDSTPCAVWDLM